LKDKKSDFSRRREKTEGASLCQTTITSFVKTERKARRAVQEVYGVILSAAGEYSI